MAKVKTTRTIQPERSPREVREYIKHIEMRNARLKNDNDRYEFNSLRVNLWLPGCRIKDNKERRELRERFVAELFWSHIPCDWQETDAIAVRTMDADTVIEIAERLDPDYCLYKKS
jgi:hypothetical protein